MLLSPATLAVVFAAVVEPDVRRFAARVRPLLEQRPIEHNLLLTLLSELVATSDIRDAVPLCIRVADREIVGVGLRESTAWPLLVSRMPAAAIEAVVDLVGTILPTLTGVSGLEPEPAMFAEAWRRRSGRTVGQRSAMWLYQLERVLMPPVGPNGTARLARPDELDQLVAWATAANFSLASGPPAVALRVATRRLFVWDQGGGAVSMARVSSPVAGVARVGFVYTPPAYRRRGYASALVAAMSQLILDEGAESCVLYTDADNPTSNAIYRALGYRQRYEVAAYTFAAMSEATAAEVAS